MAEKAWEKTKYTGIWKKRTARGTQIWIMYDAPRVWREVARLSFDWSKKLLHYTVSHLIPQDVFPFYRQQLAQSKSAVDGH